MQNTKFYLQEASLRAGDRQQRVNKKHAACQTSTNLWTAWLMKRGYAYRLKSESVSTAQERSAFLAQERQRQAPACAQEQMHSRKWQVNTNSNRIHFRSNSTRVRTEFGHKFYYPDNECIRVFIYKPYYFVTECSDVTVFVWGRVHATILTYFTWPWPELDSVSYSGCSVVPSVTS